MKPCKTDSYVSTKNQWCLLYNRAIKKLVYSDFITVFTVNKVYL